MQQACCLYVLYLNKLTVGRRRRYVKVGKRKLRVRRYRKWTFKVKKRVVRIRRMRRRLFVRYRKRNRRVIRKGKTWKIRIGRRWCRLRRRGRYWRFRYNRRLKRLRRFKLRLRIGRRYKRIKRVRKRWRLYTKKRWRPIRCGIRRFIKYRKKRVWLKRRRGKWKARFGRRWRKIRIRKYYEIIDNYAADMILNLGMYNYQSSKRPKTDATRKAIVCPSLNSCLKLRKIKEKRWT